MGQEKKEIGVIMSVYNEEPRWLKAAINSILSQTYRAFRYYILLDQPNNTVLKEIIEEYQIKDERILFYQNPQNFGLVYSLNKLIELVEEPYIARMDADDISLATRIEKELEYLKKHPEIDIVGTQSLEFIDDITKPVQYNQYPLTHLEIEKYAHMRNPYSHPSVIFKKSKVLLSGNYQDAYLCEDYDLWIRMIQSGCICANLDEYLLAVRISKDFYKRRSGLKYVKSIHYLMRKNMKIGFFTKGEYIKNMIIRSIVYLMPNTLRSLFYSKILRKGNQNNESITYSA